MLDWGTIVYIIGSSGVGKTLLGANLFNKLASVHSNAKKFLVSKIPEIEKFGERGFQEWMIIDEERAPAVISSCAGKKIIYLDYPSEQLFYSVAKGPSDKIIICEVSTPLGEHPKEFNEIVICFRGKGAMTGIEYFSYPAKCALDAQNLANGKALLWDGSNYYEVEL